MKTFIGVLVVGLLIGVIGADLWAQDEFGLGAFAFLEGTGGPRALALGGAFVSLADDWTAAFWNPAGLSRVQTASFGLMSQDRFQAGIWDNFLAGNWPLKGLSLGGYLNALQITGLIGKTSGSDQEFVFALSSAFVIQPGISLGITGKHYSQALLEESSKGFGFDIGLLYQPLDYLNLGLVVKDIGNTVVKWTTGHKDLILAQVKVGASLKPWPEIKILTEFDYILKNKEALWRFGTEVSIAKLPIQLRAGAKFLPDQIPTWSIGLGWQIGKPRFRIDIAYIAYPQLPDTWVGSVAAQL